MMPKLDGFKVAVLLKQEPATAEIPVVFVSARGAAKDKVRGLNLGAEEYLTKPFEPEEFRARIQKVLRGIHPTERVDPLTSGRLEAMSLASIIELFETERRTVRLLLARGEERGEVIFENGRIPRAAQGIRKGKAAVYQLLAWREGTFQMGKPEAGSRIGGAVEVASGTLLAEGIRRLNEIPGLRAGLSNPPMRMEVEAGLRAAVRAQARPEGAAVVALLDGMRNLDQVLAQSPLDDWATLRILHALRRAGVLTSADAGVERRGGPRLAAEMPIEYQSLQLFESSVVFNLSALGGFIRTPTPLEMGEQLALRFRVPGSELPLNLVGQVVWRNADPGKPGGVGMGIRFVEMTAHDREAIERHVAEAIAAQVSGAEEES
jgi:uncharacterized protein (TIGR02266 family)